MVHLSCQRRRTKNRLRDFSQAYCVHPRFVTFHILFQLVSILDFFSPFIFKILYFHAFSIYEILLVCNCDFFILGK